MRTMDLRIEENHSISWYKNMANEYLQKIGREVNGECTMSDTQFKAVSYATNSNEKQLNMTINYNRQVIEII